MKLLLIIYVCFSSVTCLAQEVPVTTQQQLENLQDENLEDDTFLLQLEFYKKHPVNLNTATEEELQPLRFLTALQINYLLQYRLLFGKLINIYELQAVPGFDIITIKKIMPYVWAGPAVSVKEDFISRFHGGDREALLRFTRVLENSKGYDTALPTHYLGDRNRLLFRYRYQYKNLLYYGIIADKDAGEQFFKGRQKLGFDFYSIHFFARNLGKLKALAVGDYAVNLGQGLTQWQSLAFGKSVDVMNVKRQSPVLVPYRSSGEFYFNRGAGATVQFKRWEATAFISYKKFSGNLDADSIDRFTSFGTSGYYRTNAEIADRYQLTDLSFGGNLSFSKSSFKVGINMVTHQFSLPLEKRAEPYNYYAFAGRSCFNGSVDYSVTQKNAHFFGEAAIDKYHHLAIIQGALISLDSKVDFSIIYRALGKKYQSLFGNAFTENTLPTNEEGVYVGLALRPVSNWQLAAYADLYQFPFLKYRVSGPTKGWDYLAQIGYTPNKLTEIYIRYRTEAKPIDDAASAATINYPFAKIKQSLRLQYSFQVAPYVSFKARTEVVWFDQKGEAAEQGFLNYVEAAFQPLKNVKSTIRLQYFETDSYNSRIYSYESDVLYSFSIPAFYDKGFRYYLNASYGLSKRLTLYVRLSQTAYKDKLTAGTGLDEINGNKRTEIKVEVKYNF